MKSVCTRFVILLLAAVALVGVACSETAVQSQSPSSYGAIETMYGEILEARRPKLVDGVADYSPAAMTAQREQLAAFEKRLMAIDPANWPVPQKIDYLLVVTTLRDWDFSHRVARPWSRDPGLYVDMLQQLPFTRLPVAADQLPAFRTRLASVSKVVERAKVNLTEGGGEFTAQAIRNLEVADGVGHMHPVRPTPPPGVIGWYADLAEQLQKHHPDLVADARTAQTAVAGLRDWLVSNRSRMNAPSGVGLKEYDWYLRYVRMMPYDHRDVLAMGRREMARARSFVALDRNRFRNVPAIQISGSAGEYQARIADADKQVREFIVREGFITIPPYVQELDTNVPWMVRPGGPNFWENVQFRDPRPDHVHAVIPGHRFDGKVKQNDTRAIRGRYSEGSRSEGWATYLEEAFLQSGLLDDRPRTRELFYWFLAKRAARNEPEVRLHENVWTIEQATDSMVKHVKWLDSGVARVDAEIYLRRPPGYGMGYLMGKLQMDELLSDAMWAAKDTFNLKAFHDRFMATGTIPISLIRWEMLGDDSQVRHLWPRQGRIQTE